MTTKKCSKCKLEKPLTEFSIVKHTRKTGNVKLYPSSWCKQCASDHINNWQKKPENRAKITAYRKAWVAANKDKIAAIQKRCYLKRKEELAVIKAKITEDKTQ